MKMRSCVACLLFSFGLFAACGSEEPVESDESTPEVSNESTPEVSNESTPEVSNESMREISPETTDAPAGTCTPDGCKCQCPAATPIVLANNCVWSSKTGCNGSCTCRAAL